MPRDYTFDTLTKNLRNRIIAGGFKTNPVPVLTQELMTQVNSGKIPIYSVSNGTSSTIVPCLCGNPFPTGLLPRKDMDNEYYTNEFDPYDYQGDLFPGMADFVDGNIVAGDKDEGDRLTASYWSDLGNDVFDDWGYFYLYDPSLGQYYFPLIQPQNQDDGVLTTQTFYAFGRTFMIIHGWAAQGIFKFDITVADSQPFRFGAYGNMGFDSYGLTEDLTYPNSIGGGSQTLYYHHTEDINNLPEEQLYSYFVPKNLSENNSKTYDAYYIDDDNMSIVSKEVTSGLIVYFAKGMDTKDWVTYDINNM